MVLDALCTELRRYRPADAREAAFVERMHALAAQPAPLARASYLPGHFTASAFVLSPDRARLLLVFHDKLELLLQPGGHVEPADGSLALAARREVAEEVGLADLSALGETDAIFDVDIHRIPARPVEPAHEHFDVRFAFVSASWSVRPNGEVREPRWVALTDIERVGTDESVLRAARKLRAY